MKKLLLFLSLSFFLITLRSQDVTYNIFATQTASWDGTNWDYNQINQVHMMAMFQGRSMIINDRAHSSYYIYESQGEGEYTALDEKGRKCFVLFRRVDQYTYICVMYSDILIRYFYL